MAPQHPPRFLQLVNDAKKRVKETNVDEVRAKLDRGEKFVLVDVREESEWAKDHLPGAVHCDWSRDLSAPPPASGPHLLQPLR